MYKKISSIILWVAHKTWKRSTPDESVEWEGGLGDPYYPRKWMDDYYRPGKDKRSKGSGH